MGLKNPSRNGLPPDPAVHSVFTGHTLLPLQLLSGWSWSTMLGRPAADSALGFCSRLQMQDISVSYISSSWPPMEPTRLPSRCLISMCLVSYWLLGMNQQLQGTWNLHSSVPLNRCSQSKIPETGSPALFLAHGRHSNIDWTDVWPQGAKQNDVVTHLAPLLDFSEKCPEASLGGAHQPGHARRWTGSSSPCLLSSA